MRKIITSGYFDPLHVGHLRLGLRGDCACAESAKQRIAAADGIAVAKQKARTVGAVGPC